MQRFVAILLREIFFACSTRDRSHTRPQRFTSVFFFLYPISCEREREDAGDHRRTNSLEGTSFEHPPTEEGYEGREKEELRRWEAASPGSGKSTPRCGLVGWGRVSRSKGGADARAREGSRLATFATSITNEERHVRVDMPPSRSSSSSFFSYVFRWFERRDQEGKVG